MSIVLSDLEKYVDVENHSVYLFADGENFPLNIVHPLKSKYVKRFLAQVFPPYVEAIVLYGSCLTLNCQPWSDIDVYIITQTGILEASRKLILEALHVLCEPLGKWDCIVESSDAYFSSTQESGSLEREVYRNGAVIYAKER